MYYLLKGMGVTELSVLLALLMSFLPALIISLYGALKVAFDVSGEDIPSVLEKTFLKELAISGHLGTKGYLREVSFGLFLITFFWILLHLIIVAIIIIVPIIFEYIGYFIPSYPLFSMFIGILLGISFLLYVVYAIRNKTRKKNKLILKLGEE